MTRNRNENINEPQSNYNFYTNISKEDATSQKLPKEIPGFYYDHELNRYFPIKNDHTQSFSSYTQNIKEKIQLSNLMELKSILNILEILYFRKNR